jgi:hypothetical protein
MVQFSHTAPFIRGFATLGRRSLLRYRHIGVRIPPIGEVPTRVSSRVEGFLRKLAKWTAGGLDGLQQATRNFCWGQQASGGMTELPEATITLVFTDIEGSTRLLEFLGDSYGGVLA